MDRQPTTGSADPLAATGESLDDRLLRRALKRRLFGTGIPVRAGRYELQKKIGAGGMGVVYAAVDPELDRRVALNPSIAEILGVPVGTVRTRLRRAKALLGEQLQQLAPDRADLDTTSTNLEDWARSLRGRAELDAIAADES